MARKSQQSHIFYSSLVVEHIVPEAKSAAFERWHNTLINTAKHHAGFVRADLNPPLICEDHAVKWYSTIHFNSPENLESWMNSKARKEIIDSGRTILSAYRFKSFTTGLEGWFSKRASTRTNKREASGLGPPAWKQILAVVLGLYPLIMLRIKLFPNTGLIGEWSPSGAMLLATLATSSVLAVVVMPMVTKIMSFWLYPAYRQTQWKIDFLGAIAMATGLSLMVYIFDRI